MIASGTLEISSGRTQLKQTAAAEFADLFHKKKSQKIKMN